MTAIKILLIEDDVDVSDAVATVLNKKNYQVTQVFDGEQGLQQALTDNYDLLLLDNMLPRLNGMTLLSEYRKKRLTPVIFLTACGTEEQCIDGLKLGADDYITKPFNMTVLQLRIDAVLRRISSSASSKRQRIETLPEAAIKLDVEAMALTCNGQSQILTPLEFDLVTELLTQQGQVLSKEYLYQVVLNKPFTRYDRSLDVHISNIRAKLARLSNDHVIKTVHGKGYKML